MKSKSYKENNFKKLSIRLLLVVVIVFSLQTAYSQDDDTVEIITHKVELGETMLMISKKYLVPPTKIYKLNKEAIDGVKEGMVLTIPQTIKSKNILAERTEKKEKEVLADNQRKTEKENKYFEKIDKKKLKQYNKDLVVKDSISNLENALLSSTKNIESQIIKSVEHRVISGETLFGLAKKYTISVDELVALNKSTLKNGLKADQFLIVSSNIKPIKNVEKSIDKKEDLIEKESELTTEFETITHKVLPKETLYGISKKYNISIEDLKKQNKDVLVKGMLIDLELTLKVKK